MSLTRRDFIAQTLAGAAFSVAPAAWAKEGDGASPSNVLMIAVDDMHADLGCYGSPLVQTPHLSRLAAQGVRFDRAYCQFPLCSPSRTSILTGLRPGTTRVLDLLAHFRAALPDVVTLPQMFIRAGYYVARVGKIYHYGVPDEIGTNGLDDRASWLERFNPAGVDHTVLETDVIDYTAARGRKGPGQPRLGTAMAYLPDGNRPEDHTDGKVATQAIQLLERHRNKPFFIAAGFYRPHCPWIAPESDFDRYPMERIHLPALDADTWNKYPAPALSAYKPWPYFGVTPEQARECLRAYYASISFVDAQVGRLLDALDRLRLRESTIVVFWSDHGFHTGQHGLWFKQSLFEEAARVPLIISAPGHGKGLSSPRVVESLDLYPTLAALAGIRPPTGLQGASLVPLLSRPNAAWPKLAFTQVLRGRFAGHSVRSEKWRYTVWDGGRLGEELYDEENDPAERTNLSGDPRCREVAAFLRERLREMHLDPAQPLRAEPGMKERFS